MKGASLRHRGSPLMADCLSDRHRTGRWSCSWQVRLEGSSASPGGSCAWLSRRRAGPCQDAPGGLCDPFQHGGGIEVQQRWLSCIVNLHHKKASCAPQALQERSFPGDPCDTHTQGERAVANSTTWLQQLHSEWKALESREQTMCARRHTILQEPCHTRDTSNLLQAPGSADQTVNRAGLQG